MLVADHVQHRLSAAGPIALDLRLSATFKRLARTRIIHLDEFCRFCARCEAVTWPRPAWHVASPSTHPAPLRRVGHVARRAGARPTGATAGSCADIRKMAPRKLLTPQVGLAIYRAPRMGRVRSIPQTCLDYSTCVKFGSSTTTYNGRAGGDVTWTAVGCSASLP